MATTPTPGCTPGIVPCAPGFRWDSMLCRCVNYNTTPGPLPPPGVPIPGAPAATTPWYKRPIVWVAVGGVVLFLTMRK